MGPYERVLRSWQRPPFNGIGKISQTPLDIDPATEYQRRPGCSATRISGRGMTWGLNILSNSPLLSNELSTEYAFFLTCISYSRHAAAISSRWCQKGLTICISWSQFVRHVVFDSKCRWLLYSDAAKKSEEYLRGLLVCAAITLQQWLISTQYSAIDFYVFSIEPLQVIVEEHPHYIAVL